jgi:hypothetical protein
MLAQRSAAQPTAASAIEESTGVLVYQQFMVSVILARISILSL